MILNQSLEKVISCDVSDFVSKEQGSMKEMKSIYLKTIKSFLLFGS